MFMTTNQLMAFEYFAVALFILLTILIIIAIALEICNLTQQRKHIASSSNKEQTTIDPIALLDEVRNVKSHNAMILSMCKELRNITQNLLQEVNDIKQQQDIKSQEQPSNNINISSLSVLSDTDLLSNNIEMAMRQL
ncbi:hypothetical protein FDZ58_02615 [Ehrlichia ruminantium]|uniref:Uncharacterized protein n=2 Tax=Ehrlichia ruminantium TaxID=779 RepID=A0A161M7B8_EHRRU|nr:hypothetical protein FDZ68_02605 [Ehrlichia ruminantium]CAI27926.1 Hypothetical protein ERGA_CDS_04740 [Ehrlichia ruminantium str. Gardel]QLK51464.1 hypothetical protein FDZ66_02610 [Ehrlichia ruminantium]QLK56970.1 hypothetical protein FDZ60_02615 [Ehrlichia ruminantium]QLK58799.1 hypothetical protein FDZ58_02615 [Ehrlichia ruminantium]